MSEMVDHEVVVIFKKYLYPLSAKLTEMLNEHFSHQTERRGCGYTQATRVIAEFVSQARDPMGFQDLRIFEDYDTKTLKNLLNQSSSYGLVLQTWRNLDLNADVQQCLQRLNPQEGFAQNLQQEIEFQSTLRHIHQYAEREESKLICQLLTDIILPQDAAVLDMIDCQSLAEKPKVGSCPMAEKFFLRIAHHRLLRQGEINIFVDEHEQPIMIEKLNMGDNHSCISLVPLMMNGVRLPAGSLFSADYDIEQLVKHKNKQYKGYVIPIAEMSGFWFLRLTTLAVSPENRARAFGYHFKQQVDNGLFRPDSTELSQLMDIAHDQIYVGHPC
ncbi:hypothetical protein [Acinetobacter colistiniresistens]|uniref:Uncharacterized protein n=1 Tax=Acinetobacter colistiniresistens TaxID=280145 RepID=S3T710_9GAMM|nr:hypothetical protein [Acinetobacter colistiniresistens]EPG37321.1 hypothetical protein F907_01290 [Acinetobacter colistiniresistens]TVT81523.1 hypothetical protein FPV60_10705 [Acinetobacter colistiniresistens]